MRSHEEPSLYFLTENTFLFGNYYVYKMCVQHSYPEECYIRQLLVYVISKHQNLRHTLVLTSTFGVFAFLTIKESF